MNFYISGTKTTWSILVYNTLNLGLPARYDAVGQIFSQLVSLTVKMPCIQTGIAKI